MLKLKLPKIETLYAICLLVFCWWAAVEYSLVACEAAYPPEQRYDSAYEKCPIPRAVVNNPATAVIAPVFRLFGDLIHDIRDELLAIGTIAIAAFTFTLWRSTDRLWRAGETQIDVAQKALAASTKATAVLVDMERPYLAGGGDFSNKTGKELYRFDIENHGKTPGFVVAYGFKFAKLEDLQKEFPIARDVPRCSYIESLSPQGARKEIPTHIEKEDGKDIVFGCVWYEDIWRSKYSSRFILRIAATRDIKDHGLTRLSGIDGASSDYWKWEYPNKERT